MEQLVINIPFTYGENKDIGCYKRSTTTRICYPISTSDELAKFLDHLYLMAKKDGVK